jgi:ADP-heptose:LPS heptosyltransferase
VHPGAGKLPNVWPAERFAAVLTFLQRDRNARVVMTEGPSDAAIAGALAEILPGAQRWRAPLGETLGLLAAADLVLCNDTGMSHVAAAVGVPTVVVFGPTDPARWRPPGAHVHAVCSATGSILDVEVSAVLQAARAALDGRFLDTPATRC